MSKPIINLPDERKGDPVLKDLESGDMFMYHGNLYMKVPQVMCYDTKCDHCVISLKSGLFVKSTIVDDWDTVIPVKVTMEVEYE